MKYIILVPDGMADYPIEELGGKTPLAAARTPNMDFISQNGIIGRVKHVPDGMSPASDVANLSLLGYDPKVYYTGRAPLEAANLGIKLKDDEVAFRCNLITAQDDKLTDYSAGHISSKEAVVLIKHLDKHLGSKTVKFYPGVSYRHLVVIKSENPAALLEAKCWPPHDIMGTKVSAHLPQEESVQILTKLMQASQALLQNHEINHVRIDLGENPANMIWLWGQGKKPNLPAFKERFGLTGAVISAVDLIKGMGRILGLEVIDVPGATAYYDTDYFAKAKYALQALKKNDFVYVHVEAPDEAGHNGDLREKLTAIERFDQLIVGKFLSHFKTLKNFRIMISPDHATPISVRTHVSDPVCFAIYGKDISGCGCTAFNEAEAEKSAVYFENGAQLLEYFIKGK